MKTSEILALQDEYVLRTHAPTRLLVKGQGARVWDGDGKEYLDFGCGISVCNLGHCHPTVTEALQRQAARLVHVSNLYANELQPQLAAAVARASFQGRVFFCNSGAEANEGLIKFARKWGSTRGGRYEIIGMEHAFHGRTLGSLSATPKPAIQQGFAPLLEGFKFVPYNDLAAVEAAIGPKTCAVLLEAIQGEGGVLPAAPGYLAGLRELCDRKNLLLLLDEVQTGIGRTGRMFAYQHAGIEPDAMSMAKALGNGFPIGAFEVQRKWQDVFGPGSHATTFGGTPLACAAALAVFQAIAEEDLLFNVQKMGEHLRGALLGLVAKYPQVLAEVRGLGLMMGLECKVPAKALIGRAADLGLLVIPSGDFVIRVYPPLNVTPAEITQAVSILDQAIGGL